MKKKLFSFLLAFVMVLICIMPITASATALEVADAYEVKITTYEELVKNLYNSPNGERYVLQNDIIVSDNENDYEIVVGSFTRCTLDLNGFTLSRSTRGIDTCLIKVLDEAQIHIIDSSEYMTGKMEFTPGQISSLCSVIYANGNVEIIGGTYLINSTNQASGCVLKIESGYVNIYDGIFDSHNAVGGTTIELRHNAYMYEVPHCNIYGGKFYGKTSNFEVSAYSDYTEHGCLFPTVYVFDGEFYLANPDHEYAGFAYCNNGWGQVIVAKGTVFYKCLNSSDQLFLDGCVKNMEEIEYEGKTGTYYNVSPGALIGCEELSMQDRLISMVAKKDISKYGPNSYIAKNYPELIQSVKEYVDVVDIPASKGESPLVWIDNTDDVKTVSWYAPENSAYKGEDTTWVELSEYRGKVLPFRFDERPEQETTLYYRALITNMDGSQIEDVIAIHYEEYHPNPPITSVQVSGIDKPVAGEHPDFTATVESEAYYINALFWTDVTTSKHKSLKETDVFEAGHEYELEIWLRANEDYKFRTDSDEWLDIVAMINDEQAEVIYPGSQISAEIKITYSVGDDYILGDVNGDGVVNISDATEIQKYAVGRVSFTEAQLLSGDVNKDGVVNISDATDIQKYAVGKLVF